MPSPSVESEQQAVAAFIDVHNLINAFGGVTGLLPLWFLRDQDVWWSIPASDNFVFRYKLRLKLYRIRVTLLRTTSSSRPTKWSSLLMHEASSRRGQGQPVALMIGANKELPPL